MNRNMASFEQELLSCLPQEEPLTRTRRQTYPSLVSAVFCRTLRWQCRSGYAVCLRYRNDSYLFTDT